MYICISFSKSGRSLLAGAAFLGPRTFISRPFVNSSSGTRVLGAAAHSPAGTREHPGSCLEFSWGQLWDGNWKLAVQLAQPRSNKTSATHCA